MGTKRNYKDSVFCRLFSDEDKLRELYNALSGKEYTKETKVEIVTLENSIFGDLQNDVSFMIDGKFIVMVEHQSTVNPNMPLRMLGYISREYEKLLKKQNLYSRRLIKVPTPELYVFYNGLEDQPVMQELKLSDAFMGECDTISIEVVVKVININLDKGAELLKKCKTLQEYSRFIHMIRARWAECGDRETAITESVRICIEEGILTEFLKRNGGEIMSFVNIELTREECEAIREEDGYMRGLEEGEAAKQREIAVKMLSMNMDKKVIAEATGLSEQEIKGLQKVK